MPVLKALFKKEGLWLCGRREWSLRPCRVFHLSRAGKTQLLLLLLLVPGGHQLSHTQTGTDIFSLCQALSLFLSLSLSLFCLCHLPPVSSLRATLMFGKS